MTRDEPSILAVCTGNVCRSPAMERLLVARLGTDRFAVSSAGTQALTGYPISAPMAELLETAGAPTGGFAARRLTPAVVQNASLILCATREHRTTVVRLVPGAVRLTFTLVEFAHLCELTQPPAAPDATAGPRQSLDYLVRMLASRRGHHTPDPDEEADLTDPYRRPASVYAASFEAISARIDPVVAALTGHPRPTSLVGAAV